MEYHPPPPPPPPPLEALPVLEEADEDEKPVADYLYRVNSARTSFRELWRDARSPGVLLLWITKLLGMKVPGSVNDPNVTTLARFEVAEADLPPDVRKHMAPAVSELVGLGFATVAAHAIEDHFHTSHLYIVTMSRADGRAVARVHLRREGSAKPPKTHFFGDVLTELSDGTFLWSTAARAALLPPPQCRQAWRVGAAPAELWQGHQAAVAQLRGITQVTAASRDAVLDLVERHHQLVSTFHLKRGLFAPLTEVERTRAGGLEQAIRSSDSATAGDAAVLFELEQLQRRKSNWATGALVLLVSVLLFVGAGRAQFSWEALALIVVILFFHELGHYLAMRASGYRNVRMFFIPLFGAAVTGQNFSAPGWKKVIVSLMGPLPGIYLGVVIGLLGIVLHSAALVKAALMTVVLNAFNLLPVLPLDGGWVMHALLFARHPLLDAAFRVLAAAALLAGGYFGGDRILMFLGGFLLLGVPVSYKLAKIAHELRRAGAVTPIPPDRDTIPPQSARPIIERLRAAFPRGASNKVLATHALHVFETISARPPGILASLGFGALHLGSFVVALLAIVLFVLGEGGDLSRIERLWRLRSRAAAATAEYVVEPARSIEVVEPAPDHAAEHATLVATFKRADEARRAFDEIARRVRDDAQRGAGAALFGQSVLVRVRADDSGAAAAARRAWLEDLEARTDDVFVHTSEAAGMLSVTADAPDDATAEALAEELGDYFGVPFADRLIPPWQPDDRANLARLPDERARHARARRTYARVATSGAEYDFNSSEFRAFTERAQRAARRGERDEQKRILRERQAHLAAKRRAAIEQVRAEGPQKVDVDVIDRYRELWFEPMEADELAADADAEHEGIEPPATTRVSNYQDASERLAEELAPRMGSLPRKDGKPLPGADRHAAKHGSAYRVGRSLRIAVSLKDPFDGAPALVRWLASRGCAEVRYRFPGRVDLLDEEP